MSSLEIKMGEEAYTERALYGGAISMGLPHRFQDLSNVREVPDHQEAFGDPDRDESVIIEVLESKEDVSDDASAVWFLQDLAREQDAQNQLVVEQSGVVEAPASCCRTIPVRATTAVAQMAISKGRQGREAHNIVRVYLANFRLKEVGTDLLITAYEPILINPLSESAGTVGAGVVKPAEQSGCMPMHEVFKQCISSFKVNDWSLFNA